MRNRNKEMERRSSILRKREEESKRRIIESRRKEEEEWRRIDQRSRGSRRSDEKQGREGKERHTHPKDIAIDDYEDRKKAREARHSAQEMREREGRRKEERQVRSPREDGQGAGHGASYRDVARAGRGAVQKEYEERNRVKEARYTAQEVRERGSRSGEDRQWRGKEREDRQWRGREREDRQWRGKEREDRDWNVRQGRGHREDRMFSSLEQFPLLPEPGNGRRGVPAPRARA